MTLRSMDSTSQANNPGPSPQDSDPSIHFYRSALSAAATSGSTEHQANPGFPEQSHGQPPNPQNASRPNDGYEIALDVLLSLGNTDHTLTPPGPSSAAIQPQPLSSSTNPEISKVLSPERQLQLLRYYRYEIAPWLDIADLSQTFGISILLYASAHKHLLSGILALASELLPRDGEISHNPGEDSMLGHLSGQDRHDIPDGDFEAQFLSNTLAMTRVQMRVKLGYETPSRDFGVSVWPEPFHGKLAAQVLTSSPNSGLVVPIYYLSLRQELSAALIDEHPFSLPLQHPNELRMPWDWSDTAAKVFHYASSALVLCAKAISLQSQDVGGPDARIQAWTSLFEELQAWYTQRPQEFRSVAEVDVPEQVFPVVIFTSGAGVLANQLYHTAMLLLLQNRPRTVRLPSNQRPTAAMSPLWHSQRICGIALNNDRKECWDPCLLSSFVVAAKGMTHGDQHQAILGGLDRVRRITGWNTVGYGALLRTEWGFEPSWSEGESPDVKSVGDRYPG